MLVYIRMRARPPHPPVQSYGNSAWVSPQSTVAEALLGNLDEGVGGEAVVHQPRSGSASVVAQ